MAVANVDAVVTRGSAIDEHARHNTTSVYTAAAIFPMLPEKLSTDITSLGFHATAWPGSSRNDDRPGRFCAGLRALRGIRPQLGEARVQ